VFFEEKAPLKGAFVKVYHAISTILMIVCEVIFKIVI